MRRAETGDERTARERLFARRFFSFVAAVWIGTAVLFGLFVVRWSEPVSVAQYVLMVVFLFSFAFGFSKRVFSLVMKPTAAPRLETLPRRPRVAVLYTTMNDVVPVCLRAAKPGYPEADVWVLDDSSDPAKRATVDRLAAELGFQVLRRTERKGFKAGALNNWLRLHGTGYEYFVLLDADSILPRDWVGHALLFAEHPGNARTAIFQGMIDIWNTDRPFPATLAPVHKINQDEWERKIAPALGAVVCYGHNVMFRTAPLLASGGFDERFVSEDFATAVKLADLGWASTFLPLRSWEAMPENVRGFVKRQTKWTRGSMEFFTFVPPSKLPWWKKVLLLSIPWGHIAYVAIMAAILLAVFGRISTIGTFLAFGHNLLAAPLQFIWSIPLFAFIIVLTLFTSTFNLAKIVQVRLRFLTFYRARLLGKAIGAVMLPHELRAIAMYLIDRTRKFPVTPKDEPPMRMREIVSIGRGSLGLVAGISAGLALWNPVGLYYNALWVLPFLTAPFVLHHYCGPQTAPKVMRNGGHRDLLADPRLRTAADRDPTLW